MTALRSVVEELDNHQREARRDIREGGEGGGALGRVLAGGENRRVQLAARVEGLKAEVVGTMKKVVEVVSNYTGSALPDNARDLIKRLSPSLYLYSVLFGIRLGNFMLFGREQIATFHW